VGHLAAAKFQAQFHFIAVVEKFLSMANFR